MNGPGLGALFARLGLIGLWAGLAAAVAYWAVQAPEPRRLYWRYHGYLDGLAIEAGKRHVAGRTIAIQAGITFLAVALIVVFGVPIWLCLVTVALSIVMPQISFVMGRRQRVTQIEMGLCSFGVNLANSLRANASIGKALARTEEIAVPALRVELQSVLRDIRVGASVDQALKKMCERVNSPLMDSLIACVIIARRLGGNVSASLEQSSGTLEELARLKGVLRSKTAEARGQLWVLALTPPVLFVAFDSLQKGYFDSMFNSLLGQAFLFLAGLLWVTSIALGVKFMRVEL